MADTNAHMSIKANRIHNTKDRASKLDKIANKPIYYLTNNFQCEKIDMAESERIERDEGLFAVGLKDQQDIH